MADVRNLVGVTLADGLGGEEESTGSTHCDGGMCERGKGLEREKN